MPKHIGCPDYDAIRASLYYASIHHFAERLQREDRATREAVGIAIDTEIDWTKHQFPKTRSLYKYRYVRQPRNA